MEQVRKRVRLRLQGLETRYEWCLDKLDRQTLGTIPSYTVPLRWDEGEEESVLRVEGARIVLCGTGLSARCGEVCFREADGTFSPDYSVWVLYPEAERDPNRYLAWQQGGLAETLSEYARLSPQPVSLAPDTVCILEIETNEREAGNMDRFAAVEDVKRARHRSWINLRDAALYELGRGPAFDKKNSKNVMSSSISVLHLCEERSGMSAEEILREIERRDLIRP